MADIITSLGVTLSDIGWMVHQSFYNLDNPATINMPAQMTSTLEIYIFLCSFLPFWWRFLQCLKKWWVTGNRLQLINAGKYTARWLPAVLLKFYGWKMKIGEPGFWPAFFMMLFATEFALTWDFLMDWGLFRTHAPGRKYLRDNMKYSPRFYYTVMILNTIFRHWWLLDIFPGITF